MIILGIVFILGLLGIIGGFAGWAGLVWPENLVVILIGAVMVIVSAILAVKLYND